MKEQCQVNGCNQPVKYVLYRFLPDGSKVWLHVCDMHEQEIAKENFRYAGGYLTQKQLDEIRAMRGASRFKG